VRGVLRSRGAEIGKGTGSAYIEKGSFDPPLIFGANGFFTNICCVCLGVNKL
jgi:hypothetical protein